MGIEYKLRFAFSDSGQVESLLQSMPNLSKFRSPQNIDTMPDAFVKIESDGLYLCDNGGEGKVILEALAQKITQEFGSISMEDL
jgi:hypothetical protein